MSVPELRLLQAGSFSVDFSLFGQMLPEYAYQHGMMGRGETPEQADRRTEAFIENHLERAILRQDGKQGIVTRDALTEFGKAVHPVMDRLSPAHAGLIFEGVPTDVNNLLSMTGIALETVGVKAHSAKESKITRKLFEQAVDDVRRYYLKTFGRAAFKKATGCDTVEECEHRYEVLKQEYREN
jgi:hypothetical protein